MSASLIGFKPLKFPSVERLADGTCRVTFLAPGERFEAIVEAFRVAMLSDEEFRREYEERNPDMQDVSATVE